MRVFLRLMTLGSLSSISALCFAENSIPSLNQILPEGTSAFSFTQEGGALVELSEWKKFTEGTSTKYSQNTKDFSVPTDNKIVMTYDASKTLTDITALSVRKPYGVAQSKHWNAHIEKDKIISLTLCEGGAGKGEGCVTASVAACDELKGLTQSKDYRDMETKLNDCSQVVGSGYLNEGTSKEEERSRALMKKFGASVPVNTYPNHLSSFATGGNDTKRSQWDARRPQVAEALRSIAKICAHIPLTLPASVDPKNNRSPIRHEGN